MPGGCVVLDSRGSRRGLSRKRSRPTSSRRHRPSRAASPRPSAHRSLPWTAPTRRGRDPAPGTSDPATWGSRGYSAGPAQEKERARAGVAQCGVGPRVACGDCTCLPLERDLRARFAILLADARDERPRDERRVVGGAARAAKRREALCETARQRPRRLSRASGGRPMEGAPHAPGR